MDFNNNWFLFLLIVMLVFSGDGNVSRTETNVYLGILFALTLSGLTVTENDTSTQGDDSNCFCNR